MKCYQKLQMMTQSLLFFQLQFLLAFRVQQQLAIILILTTRRPEPPHLKFFANQFKCTNRKKISVFVLKGAISGPQSNFFMQ